MQTVAIIGLDDILITSSTLRKIYTDIKNIITNSFNLDLSNIHYVSTGAADVDHLALVLFRQYYTSSKLTLYLPSLWIDYGTDSRFFDTGEIGNIGRKFNYRHSLLSDTLGWSSLSDINYVHGLGAQLITPSSELTNDLSRLLKVNNVICYSNNYEVTEEAHQFVNQYKGRLAYRFYSDVK